jgi:hypothetical protein
VRRARAARADARRRPHGAETVLRPRRCRTGPARPEGGSQRLTVRMSSRLAEGPGRLEVVLPDRILEQYESAGDVGGLPEAIAPRGRRRPGIGSRREHVFVKLRPPSDGPTSKARKCAEMA